MEDEELFDQQLGPFYDDHGPEIIPSGFDEAHERLLDCLGEFSVRSNQPELHGLKVSITHYDLTRFIQEEWDRLNNPEKPPRKGFILSSLSPSAAAGRAAEEVVLQKLCWRLLFGSTSVARTIAFWDAVDEGLLVRPRGVASDDIVLELSDGSLACVEAKASFNGKAPFMRFRTKAVSQLQATLQANPKVSHAVLAFVDLKNRDVLLVSARRDELLEQGTSAVEQIVSNLG
ncbi:MAG: hypothetical protein JNK63_08580 [Chthonomonas sp.]|nr:hypothetical protein [Chthonomonas sp.]